jgi:hypothetical protein
MVVYATWLYLTVLALHYLEYHMLMAPRCFGETTGPRTGVLGTLRRASVFYALLAVTVVLFEARSFVVSGSFALRYVVHIFDGIFVLHYVLDAFLWKFRNPFYRAQLYPLYFQRRLRPSPGVVSPGTWRVLAGVTGAFALAFLIPSVRNELAGAASSFQKLVIDPLHAEEYVRWAKDSAEAGRLNDAEHDFKRAAQLAPGDLRLQGWMRMLNQAQQRERAQQQQ